MTGFGITARQADALHFIRAFHAQNGKYPSFSEIADGIGVKSRSTVTQLLKGLQERGRIRRLPRRVRAIKIIDHTVPGALPAAVQAQLNDYCEAFDEKPADVIADAVTLHLDALAAEPGGEGLLTAANRLNAEQAEALAVAHAVLRRALETTTLGAAHGQILAAIAMIEGRTP